MADFKGVPVNTRPSDTTTRASVITHRAIALEVIEAGQVACVSQASVTEIPSAILGSSGAVATSTVLGIAVVSSDPDMGDTSVIQVTQAFDYAFIGPITGFTGLAVGVYYYLSSVTPGSICPIADLVTGDSIVQVGYATSPTTLFLEKSSLGTVVPAP